MKTLNLVTLTILFTITLSGYGQMCNQQPVPVEKEDRTSVCITLQNAQTLPFLVQAIYQQVDPSFLNNATFGIYTVSIVLKNHTYLVSGRIAEWKVFFGFRPTVKMINYQKVKD